MLDRTQVESEISGLYLTTIGRAPDSAGVAYWVDQVMNGNLTVSEVGQSFFDQPEVQTKYADLDTDGFVTAVYENVLGRVPDEDGLNYWKEELESGNISNNSFIEAINNGALGDDAVKLQNQKDIGLAYMKKIGDDIPLASSILDLVDVDVSTKAEALAIIDYYNANKTTIDPEQTDLTHLQEWEQDDAYAGFVSEYEGINIDDYFNNLNSLPDVIARTEEMYAEYETPETVYDEQDTETDNIQDTYGNSLPIDAQPSAAAFEFSNEWLNGKTLYDIYVDEGNIYTDMLIFTDTLISAPSHNIIAPYEILDGGIMQVTDDEGTSYVKATHIETDDFGNMEALDLIWSDSLEVTQNTSYEMQTQTNYFNPDIFVLDVANVEKYQQIILAGLDTTDMQTASF